MKKTISQWFCLAGSLQIVFYLLQDFVGAYYYPNYNRFAQAVSDLTAVNAPSYSVAVRFTQIYALLSVVGLSMLCTFIKPKLNRQLRIGIYLFTIMNWISCIGYALFPLTDSGFSDSTQDFIHVYIVTVMVVVLSIISLIFIIIGGLKEKHKHIAYLSLIALCLMFIGAIGSGIVPKEYFGVIERFSTYSAVVFGSTLCVYGWLLKLKKE
ncbi:DUF998 domain-containing protein [Paenibacillus anaericanus]|uniref:DUF998 domain-containing protein n=1 Tax=Paenibacillus anaericanus TaxID=170367 RepID=A0A433Y111_9BACL|nr:DUF998 domain-containing protein [Paenibacillus anaericanus]RUT41375.1 DUF998 domain-containing protein [Paenibacillus anaericanus]